MIILIIILIGLSYFVGSRIGYKSGYYKGSVAQRELDIIYVNEHNQAKFDEETA